MKTYDITINEISWDHHVVTYRSKCGSVTGTIAYYDGRSIADSARATFPHMRVTHAGGPYFVATPHDIVEQFKAKEGAK